MEYEYYYKATHVKLDTLFSHASQVFFTCLMSTMQSGENHLTGVVRLSNFKLVALLQIVLLLVMCQHKVTLVD